MGMVVPPPAGRRRGARNAARRAHLLGAFREGIFPDAQTDLAHDALAQLAATKAVRLPEIAGETELRALVSQLFASRTPLTSPAGRPTYIELNHGELARRFQK